MTYILFCLDVSLARPLCNIWPLTPSLSLLPPLVSMISLYSRFPSISLSILSQPPSTAQFLFTSMASILLDFALCACLVTQSCPTLCNPTGLTPLDCSPPVSSVHGIFQATTLEQVAISYSRGYF